MYVTQYAYSMKCENMSRTLRSVHIGGKKANVSINENHNANLLNLVSSIYSILHHYMYFGLQGKF